MALRVLLLRKKIESKKKELEALTAKGAELDTRAAELETAIEETQTDEEREAVEGMITEYETDKAEHDEAKAKLEAEIRELEDDLAGEEEKQDTAAPVDTKEPTTEREVKRDMAKRCKILEGMTRTEREALVTRAEVKTYIDAVRDSIKNKRALTNAGLTIPEVMLGLIRENVENYSKLYRHVNVRPLTGNGRLVIAGTVPEAVWTDCCANLNELDLTFNDVEVGCWKVGGYFAVCNAIVEDSDIDIMAELLEALGQAIGLALDKAILYGTGTRMPLGIVTRLVQTEAPADYPATARTWVDLHTTNIKTIAASVTGKDLFAEFVTDSGAAKGKYSRGEKVWAMNETTYTALIAQAMSIDAGGAIVSGVNGVMPVVGGIIEVLSFIPDNVIIGGYLDLYLLAERAGNAFYTSEHVRFLQDQTVIKGTGRYDGQPVIAEGFVAIGIKGTTPNATMSFAPDSANP